MKKRLLSSALIITGIFSAAFGQNKGNEASADRTLRGSGRVNASTLGMEFDLPLGAYPGRGINVPISLSYSSKQWRMVYIGDSPVPGGNGVPCFKHYSPRFAEESASGWTTSMAVPYIEYTGIGTYYNAEGNGLATSEVDCPDTTGGNQFLSGLYVRRILLHLPSGETHEMRPDDTVISFTAGGSHPNDPNNPANWNATYYAADGSNIKYIQNSANGTYKVLMPDGSFYNFDATTPNGIDRKAVKFTDRNGNYTSYYPPGTYNGINYANGYWQDTLGRKLAVPLGLQAPNAPTTENSPQEYSMPGMTETYKFQWKQLKGGSAAESGLTNFSDSLKYYGDTYTCGQTYCSHSAETYLFAGGAFSKIVSNTLFNPIVLTEIELPTGQKYEFSYDTYGRIEQIKYPTGGEEHFDYSVVPTLSTVEPDDVGSLSNFGVTDRKVYKYAGDTSPYEWTYSANYSGSQGYQVNINNPDGTRVERFLHRGNGTNVESRFGYDNGLAGMAYEERGI